MNFLFLQTTNPATIIQQYGPLVGSAVICTGLFIWSQIQIYMLKNSIDSNAKQLKTNYGVMYFLSTPSVLISEPKKN